MTPRAVRVETAAGQPLDVRRTVDGSRLQLALRVDQALLSDPPPGVRVTLAGLPSLHALRGRGGASLEAEVQVDVTLRPRLEAGTDRVRLLSIDGRAPTGAAVWMHGERLELVFAGVLDPASLQPQALPLVPLAQGLSLTPVHALVAWVVQGDRTTVVVDLSGLPSPLELYWARVGWRGLDGLPPEAPAVMTLHRR